VGGARGVGGVGGVSRGAGARVVGGASGVGHVGGAGEAGDAGGSGKLVSHHVLQGNPNALAKVAHLFNLLWRTATCSCCKSWAEDEFYSAGCFHPAVVVVGRRKRDRMLQENAAGVAKALRKWDATVSNERGRVLNKALLLEPTTALNFRKESMLSTVFTMQFALELRGATTRDVAWRDFALHQLTGTFAAAGREEPKVLCTQISAPEMTEGVVRCIGALPHVDPWVCPVGAIADALFFWFPRPRADASTPTVVFAPVFMPNDEALIAAGVKSAHFREAGTDVGFRELQRCLVVPGPNGDHL